MQLYQYKKNIGCLRGHSIEKIKEWEFASTNGYIPFDFSAAGMYGKNDTEEIRGYRFEDGRKWDLTLFVNFNDLITSTYGGSGSYAPKL